MLALNLLPPSTPLTFSKSKPSSSFLTLSSRTQLHRTRTHFHGGSLLHNPTSLQPPTGSHGFNTHPFGFRSQIRDPISKIDIFSSKPRSNFVPNPRASASETPESDPESKAKTLKLAVVFGLWYFQNIVFNIYNKKVLNLFPFPWLLASFQLLVGSIWMLTLWSLKLQPFPKISKPFFVALLGPALFHTIGHISACVSFSKVAVSFTHVIKSSEPVFSVVFSSFLGDSYPIQVWLSILPIVMGCSLAAVTEVSFNPQGLWGALISNVGFVLRNIYSKRSLNSFKEVNGLNLYGLISIVSLVYLFPVAVLVEGPQWVGGYHKAIEAVGKSSTLYLWVMLSGVFYHLYNQSSYQALDQISPLTFSVGNTMKRVVVIVSTVLVFRNPVRPLNALGSAIAIFGTFLYSQATAGKGKKSKKEDGESDLVDEAGGSSEEELSGGETEAHDCPRRDEDRELKDKLLRKYSGYISTLKHEFSKKKKKGKLPREAKQILLDWWNSHYKWPYPTEVDKVLLAESTGLDQKQISNWFINQRKRHWKPSETMQFASMDSIYGAYLSND